MLPLEIAIRYLLSKKSHSAINSITLVAACGVAIITAALICALSVYNGFESLVDKLCSNFDAELRIEPEYGKSFADSDSLRNILNSSGKIQSISATIEENALLTYGKRQIPAIIKGVDENFNLVSNIDSIIAAGEYKLEDPVAHYCVLGAGLAMQLGAGSSFVRPLTAFCPKRSGKINLLDAEDAFVQKDIYCSAIFMVSQAEYDDNICITSIDFARELLQDSALTTAYEIKLKPGISATSAKKEIAINGFKVLTRREQQADSYRIMQIEKWITFLIVIFILLIASFNIIGALSMLIIDKEEEINTLQNLGASLKFVRWIFACEGFLVSGCGAIVGIIVGVILCLIQQNYGIITLGNGSDAYIVDAYPVALQWSDVIISAISVLVIGILATLYPLSAIKVK